MLYRICHGTFFDSYGKIPISHLSGGLVQEERGLMFMEHEQKALDLRLNSSEIPEEFY